MLAYENSVYDRMILGAFLIVSERVGTNAAEASAMLHSHAFLYSHRADLVS